MNESASGGRVVDTRRDLEDTYGACNEGSGQPNLDSHDTSGGGVGVAPNNPDNNMEVGSSGGEDTKGKGDVSIIFSFYYLLYLFMCHVARLKIVIAFVTHCVNMLLYLYRTLENVTSY